MREQDLGLDLDSSQDEAELKSTCRLTQDCIDAGDNSLTLNQQTERFHCANCGQSGSFRDLVRALESGDLAGEALSPGIVDAEFTEAPVRAAQAVVRSEPRVMQLGEGQRIRSKAEIRLEQKQARRGVAAICIGGGQGGAMLLERT